MTPQRLTPLLFALALAACSGPPPAQPVPPPAHDVQQDALANSTAVGALSRGKGAQLDQSLRAIMRSTLPDVRELYAELDTFMTALERPDDLVSREVGLRDWGVFEQDVYAGAVDTSYDEIGARLQSIYDFALETAYERARSLATARSPLDPGATGDPALDLALTAFEEALRGAVGLDALGNRREEDRGRRTEIVQIFSSFGEEQAEQEMGGRLMLFAGGDETFGSPRCIAAFRADNTSLSDRRLVQVVRHRIKRGNTIVHDLGWSSAAGTDGTGALLSAEHGQFLMALAAEPVVNTEAEAYESLRDMTVVVDTQTAVLDGAGRFLGAVDWRVEFFVSARGGLTWELSALEPVFDTFGKETRALLAVN